MKKIVLLLICFSLIPKTFAIVSDADVVASEFLAKRGIIQEHYYDLDYKWWDTISRREMLKVVINLSWTSAPDMCNWSFMDLSSTDWGCKYAEEALARWYISAASYFRPDDNITKIEALKLIMKAKNIPKTNVSDWRIWYVQWAHNAEIIGGIFTDYNTSPIRWWIFQVAQDSIDDAVLDVEVREKKTIVPDPVTGYTMEQRLVMWAAKIRDIWNDFEIRQTHEYTYLYHNWNEIWSWLHSDMSSDFTLWADFLDYPNCGRKMIPWTSTYPSIEDYEQQWETITESERVNCVREQFYQSIIVEDFDFHPDFMEITVVHWQLKLGYLYDIVHEKMYYIPFIESYWDAAIKRNSDGIFIKYNWVNMSWGLLYVSNQDEVFEIYYITSRSSNSIAWTLYDYELLANGQIKLVIVTSAPTAPLVTKDVIIDKTNIPK